MIKKLGEIRDLTNEGRWCYSEKFTILLTIFELNSWKWSLWAGGHVVIEETKNFFFFWAAARCWSRGKILGVVMLFVQILQWKNYHFWRDFRDFLWKKKLGCKGTLRAVFGSSEVCPWYRNLVLKVICHNFRPTNGPNPTPAQRVWDFSLGKFGACVRRRGHWFLG